MLSRARHRNRKLYDETKARVEGGDKPVRVEHSGTVEPATLDLPLDVKRQLLAALEQQKATEQGDAQ